MPERLAFDTTPPFEAVLERYSLTHLRQTVDLRLENGRPALTKWGTLSLRTPAFDSLYRFVVGWRINAPTLNTLVESARSTPARLVALGGELEASLSEGERDRMPSRDFPASDIRDAMIAAEVGGNTYAGAVVVVLSGLLLRLKDDMEATRQEWEASGPRFGGCSAGQVIEAAGNQVRHADEWSKDKMCPTPQQMRSIKALASALGETTVQNGAMHRVDRGSVPAEVLGCLGGDFDTISAAVFSFALDMAQRVEHRTGGGPR